MTAQRQVSADTGYLARLIAGRAASVTAGADGVARFTGLAPGRYDVGVERGGERVTVDVADGDIEAAID